MFTNAQLDQLQKLLESNNKKIIKNFQQDIKGTEQALRKEIQSVEKNLHQEIKTTEQSLRQEIQTTEQKLRQEIQTSGQQLEEKLSKKIDDSQEDTIDAVSDIINTGFNMHEIRIKRLEDHLDLPPIKQ